MDDLLKIIKGLVSIILIAFAFGMAYGACQLGADLVKSLRPPVAKSRY
jgi:hypothetical protein